MSDGHTARLQLWPIPYVSTVCAVRQQETSFADAHAIAFAKESKKREGAGVNEPPGKKGKRACRLSAKCKRHLAFRAGTNEKDCPDGSH